MNNRHNVLRNRMDPSEGVFSCSCDNYGNYGNYDNYGNYGNYGAAPTILNHRV
jgi:hypothetical protein